MSFDISWLVDHKVLISTLNGDMTIDDFSEIDSTLIDLLRTSLDNNHLVHLILDVCTIGKIPTNLAEINAISHLRKEENLGWFIIISESKIIRFLGNLITQISKTRYRNFESLKEAIEFLQAQDSTIEWSTTVLPYGNGDN